MFCCRQPLTLCFHFTAVALTHKRILEAVNRKLKFVSGGTVESIQVNKMAFRVMHVYNGCTMVSIRVFNKIFHYYVVHRS